MKFFIVFPEEIFEEVHKFLLRDPSTEQFGYLFAGANTTDQFVKLLVHTYMPACEKEDLEYQSTGGVCPSPKFQMRAYSICKTQGHHLIDAHSHPFDYSDSVRFSSIDDRHEFGSGRQGVFGFTSRWNPGMYHASIVFGQNSLDARIYRSDEGRAIPIDEIQIVTSKLIIPTSARLQRSRLFHQKTETEITLPSEESTVEKKTFDGGSFGNEDNLSLRYSRQILAFGKEEQETLAKTTVAVVGAGGLGSIVVETLARLGTKEIICVDDDTIEPSNISRILSSTQEDAYQRRKKVDALGRYVKEINSDVKYIGIADSVLNPNVLATLKYADYIISGTDTYSSRLILNRISVQYLIPYINLGFGMETDAEHKKLLSAGGKVIVFIPYNWCYQCLGEINQQELQIELMSQEDRKMQITRGYISGVDIPNPSVLFLNMTVASLGICEFLNLLVPFKNRDHYLFYDMLATKLWKMRAKKNPECPACSPDAGILGRGDLLILEDIRDKDSKSNLPDNL